MDWQVLGAALAKIPWVSLLTGGVAGAFLTHHFSIRRQRTELTFKVLEQFFKTYASLGSAKGVLRAGKVQRNTADYNKVTEIGDWYEIVALFCRERWLDQKVLKKAGLLDEVQQFRKLAEGNDALKDALESWREMKSFV